MIAQKGREVTPQRKKEMVDLPPRFPYPQRVVSEVPIGSLHYRRGIWFLSSLHRRGAHSSVPIPPLGQPAAGASSVLVSCRWQLGSHWSMSFISCYGNIPKWMLKRSASFYDFLTELIKLKCFIKNRIVERCIHIWRSTSTHFGDSQDQLTNRDFKKNKNLRLRKPKDL